MSRAAKRRRGRRRGSWAPLLLLFFLSGVAALIDEIVWTRMLSTAFGSTARASALVLATFMGGMALGAALIARRGTAGRSALLTYARLEFAIGLTALAVPMGISAVTRLYVLGHGAIETWGTGAALGLDALRLLSSAILLTLPSALMGATLPVLAGLNRNVLPEERSRWIGHLYAVNTAGALAGSILTGFVLLEWLGTQGSLLAAVAINLACALGAWRLSRLEADATAAGQAGRVPRAPAGDESAAPVSAWIFAAMASSGAAALAYEVLWTRVLSLITFNTAYAFTLMLSAFLLGLALGGAAISPWLNSIRRPLICLALAQLGVGAWAGIGAFQLDSLASLFYDLQETLVRDGARWTTFVGLQGLLAVTLMLPPTVLLGMSFPLSCAGLLDPSRSAAGDPSTQAPRQVGLLYTFNTIGAVAGSLGAAFLGIELFGMGVALLAAVFLSLAAATLALQAEACSRNWPTRWRALPPAILAGAVAVVWLLDVTPDVTFRHLREGPGSSVVFHDEGPDGIVEVVENRISGFRTLLTNRLHAEGSNDPKDVFYQRKQGYLPLLLHPAPGQVMEIGLGTGIGLASLMDSRVRAAEVVEISQGVIEAAKFFRPYQLGVMSDPRLRVRLGDGRSHMLLSGRQYDVIVQGLLTPYHAGVSSLYSLDHFRRCRQRLAPGGMLAVWIALRQLAPEDLRLILRTFRRVFPVASVWSKGDYIGVFGQMEGPLSLDPAAIRSRAAQEPIASDLRRLGLSDPISLLDSFVCGPGGVEKLAGTGPVETEARPILEFTVPRSVAQLNSLRLAARNVELLNRHQESLEAYLPESTRASYLEPLQTAFRARSLALQAFVARGRDEHENAMELLALALKERPGDPMAAFAADDYLQQMALQLIDRGDSEGAILALTRAVELNRWGVLSRLKLAAMLEARGEAKRAAALRAAAKALRLHDAVEAAPGPAGD